MTSLSQRAGPLAGVKVVELASYVSGPFATMMMADLGADVIKIEPPQGDPFRRFGRAGTPVSPMFVNSNRGKEGMVLDLKVPSSKLAFDEVVKDADILLSNWRPAVAERLGLSDESIAAVNPRLIRVYVSGFGTSGPSAGAPVYDAIIQAHVGSAEMTPPTIVPAYVVDKLTASMACQAALAALFERERSGKGDRIDLALLDAAAYVNFVDVMANRTFVDSAPVESGNKQAAAIRGVQTADGWLIVTPVSSDQIRRACDAIGRPELADELLGMKDATELTTRLYDELEAATREHSTDHWVETFRAHDVPAGPCLTIEQHFQDRQVVHNRIYSIEEWEDVGRVRQVRYPARFARHGDLRPTKGPPVRRRAE